MKVIFLDVDGVLNSDRTLYKYTSLEDDLILNLKEIVDKTEAIIVLSSSWRSVENALRELIDKLFEYGMHISSMTTDGVRLKYIQNAGFTPSKKYLEFSKMNYDTGEREDFTHDRGAEIYYWLNHHKDVESFVILDDEDFDIEAYFPNNFVKTSFAVGLTKKDVDKAINILYNKDKE